MTELAAPTMQTLEPELIDRATAAAMLTVSAVHFARMEKAGRVGPMPVKLGKLCRYSVDELRRWVRAGCPPRVQWVARQRTK